MILTQREKDFGNAVVFYPKDLIFMSVDQTIEMVNALAKLELSKNDRENLTFVLKEEEMIGYGSRADADLFC